jgi:hypothetical protein
MLYAPESQQISDRFAGEIEDLQMIARMHRLPTGSPDLLSDLPLRLAQDARLRSDLAEFVRSLQMRDVELALPDVLSLVLVAVGGPSALNRRRDLEEAVDLTGGFLASLGGWPGSAVEPLIDIDNPPDHDPRLDLAASAYTETLEADLAGSGSAQAGSTAASTTEGGTSELITDSEEGASLAEITHALARLERGNLELRLHLDSIDQRICRMEPLLESVPHTATDLPPVPEPPPVLPPRPRPADQQAPPVDLVHRTSPPVAPALPSRDWLDEVKEQRRISLTSNFAEPALPWSRAATPAPAAPLRNQAVPTPQPPASTMGEALPHPRVHPPRRDRFAAAREIPGQPAEFDPLYTAPEPEQQPAIPQAPRVMRQPDTRQTQPAQALRAIPRSPADAGAATPVLPNTPSPAMGAEFAETSHHEVVPPTYLPRPSSAARSMDHELRSEPPILHRASPPLAAPALPTLFSSFDSGQSATAEKIESPARGRKPWIAGLAAAAVIGAASFLYLNGLPSAINEWVSGSTTSVSSQNAVVPQQGSTTAPESAIASSSSPSTPTRSAAPSHTLSGSAGRVLGARQSFTPTETIERISGPTFVPGGIMDGYLISAPRPSYPKLANLVGAEGKVTFEAMISKTGGVEALKVLGGPQVLRDAATDAVRQWQYRPFEIKGRPVEVRTIIRVDVATHAGAAGTE